MVIKRNFRFLVVLLSGLLLIAVWFYWFQMKPNLVRQECTKKVLEAEDEPGQLAKSEADNIYRVCLAQRGMKPEPLVNLVD